MICIDYEFSKDLEELWTMYRKDSISLVVKWMSIRVQINRCSITLIVRHFIHTSIQYVTQHINA